MPCSQIVWYTEDTMKKTHDKKFSSNAITEGLRVQAEAFFLNSAGPDYEKVHTFTYKITFTNEGSEAVQLISRHWIIIDSAGTRREVKGPGVIGEHPRLEPGDTYSYNSYSQINTPWGTMEGYYLFKKDNGETFDAEIARFYLVKDE